MPKKSGGAYIPHALIELAMVRGIPILTFEAPEDFLSSAAWLRESEINAWCEAHLKPLLNALNPRSRYSFGEDFARRGDLTCFTLLEITEDLQKREAFRVELRNMPYEQQKQIMLYILERVTRLIGAAFDATGNGGYLAEAALERFGPELVDSVMLSAKWYGECLSLNASGCVFISGALIVSPFFWTAFKARFTASVKPTFPPIPHSDKNAIYPTSPPIKRGP